MKIYGALRGNPGSKETSYGMGAMSVQQRAVALPFMESGAMTNIHLAERDPQHHRWPSDGVKAYLADANPARHVEAQHGVRGVAPSLRLRILLSFHYYKDTDLDALFTRYFTHPYPEVFLDSGGFSAMTQGATIDLDAYCAFIKRFGHLIMTYANLDAIGDAKRTLANQQRMEDKGLAPIPVFHVNEDWCFLEQYIERYPYIALGGMVPYMRDAKKKLLPWMVKCFKLAQGKAVYHGFGCTSWEVIKALPWYSVDSSSWGMGFRYGQVPLFDERAGRFVDVKLGNHQECFAKASLIRGLGFDPADFADRARNDRAKICAISALSYLKAEQWLRRRHGDIHIPARPAKDAGTPAVLRAYLADTSNGMNYRDADAGLKTYLADARGHSASDLAGADEGLRMLLADRQNGSKVNLAHAQAHGDLSDITKVQKGLQAYDK